MVHDQQQSILTSYRLDGKVAVIMGASRGIGLACAQALAQAGAEVVLSARDSPALRAAAADIPGGRALPCDVTDPEQVAATVGALERLDVLVNSAGGNLPEPFLDVTEEHLHQLFELNLMGTFRATQAAARIMRRTGAGGSIVNVSSDLGHVGMAGRSVYCATKHAVEGLTRALAVELAPLGIRVNSVGPTFIETDLTRPYFTDRAFLRSVLDRIPLNRLGQVEEVAAAVLFLASPASSLITGSRPAGGWRVDRAVGRSPAGYKGSPHRH